MIPNCCLIAIINTTGMIPYYFLDLFEDVPIFLPPKLEGCETQPSITYWRKRRIYLGVNLEIKWI